jgi:hypothetical protein
MRYIELIECRECKQCKGTGKEPDPENAYPHMLCLTCDGMGSIMQERRITSLLDLNDLLCDIHRSNLREIS